MKRRFQALLIVVIAIGLLVAFVRLTLREEITLDEAPIIGEAYFDENYKCLDCNIILISIDTLRADHLGCYDYSKNTTPNIDEFSKDSVLFKETIAQAPSTEPSHASIFTSLIPSHHGALFATKSPIPEEITTMAEIMKENNYRTISYNGGGQVAAEFGFDQGFDLYDDSSCGNRFSKTVDLAIDWIKSNPNEKFFLFLHTYEVHHDYTPEEGCLEVFEKDYTGHLPRNITLELLGKINKGEVQLSKDDEEHIVNTYDAEIYSMDKAFGALVDFLKSEDLYNDTIIIFTSDHGEEFREHGWMGWHSHTLYDELLKVPLIIKFQNSKYASKVIDEQVRSIDILPTLLDILDIPCLESFEGVSLMSWFRKSDRRELLAVSQQDGPGPKYPTTIRTKRWKLYDDLHHERLFNLELDPLEQKDILESNKEICSELQNKLDRLLNKKPHVAKTKDVKLDQETLKRLKSLGYVK